MWDKFWYFIKYRYYLTRNQKEPIDCQTSLMNFLLKRFNNDIEECFREMFNIQQEFLNYLDS